MSSSSGDDAHTPSQAQDQLTPWKTITRLNNFSGLQPGDSILFRRGDIFFGTIKINAAGSADKPLVYSAYSTGEQPVITSLIAAKNRKSIGNGIYEYGDDLFSQNLSIVLINGIIHEMGRYPNRSEANNGYLKMESHTGNNSITDNELSSTQNWTGAELVIRKNHWIIDHHKITANAGTQLQYDKGSSNYEPTNEFGFFIQNHINTLDQFGEWYYNPATKKLYVYFGNENPDLVKVEAAGLDNLLQSPQKSGVNMYLVFDQLHFKGANKSSILLNSGNYFTIRNCSIDYSGDSGVQANGVKYLTVTGCSISKSNNNGIVSIYDNPYSVIESNKIDSTHIFPGMGQSGDGNGIALYCIGQNSRVEKNRITNTGYSGIYFGGDSVLIKNNFIDRFCLVKDDGSGIYTFTGSENKPFFGRKIAGNIVMNGVGAIYGADSDYSPAEGVYIDDNASGILVADNTVANMTNYGIYLHNSRDITLRNNTIYNCSTQLVLRHDLYGGEPIRNIKINNNIFFSRLSTQKFSVITTAKNDLNNMAVLDSNFYDRPIYNEGVYISTLSNDGNSSQASQDYDLESWQNEFKQDLLSQKNKASVPEYQIKKLLGPNKFSNGNFDTSISGVESYSPTDKIKTTWMKDNLNGVLQVTSSDLSYLIIPVGNIDSKKKYILKFEMVANKASLINVYIRQFNAPYKTISKSKSFKTSVDKKVFELLIESSALENNSCIILESKDKDLLYKLDKFLFSEADVELSDIDNYIKFLYNDSFQNKSIKLNDVYYDAKNVTRNGELILEPYKSAILIKKPANAISDAPLLKADDDLNTLMAYHILGNSEIIVSENNKPYTAYNGEINVGNVYRATGYWKFKVKEADGRSESPVAESPEFNSTINDENTLKIYPNPVISEANFYISNTETGLCTISIYNLRGYKMYESKFVKDSQEANTNLNIRYFIPGVYLVLVRINGRSFLNKIIKI